MFLLELYSEIVDAMDLQDNRRRGSACSEVLLDWKAGERDSI